MTFTSTSPRFPQELLGTFIDEVANEPQSMSRLTTHQACNLVSHTFCCRARLHLFYGLVVTGNYLEDLSELQEILTEPPLWHRSLRENLTYAAFCPCSLQYFIVMLS